MPPWNCICERFTGKYLEGGMGRRSGQGEPSGHAAGMTAARPHLASVFLFQRSTEFYVPVFYL